jgi:hypothetical protein
MKFLSSKHDYIHHNQYCSLIINKIQWFLRTEMIKIAFEQSKFVNLNDTLKLKSSIKWSY